MINSVNNLELSKLQAIVEPMRTVYLPAGYTLVSAPSIETGTGKEGVQQAPDGVADGFDFTGKNQNSLISGMVPYGAVGAFSTAFGGKSSAQGKRSFAQGTTTIAKGNYSHAEGDNSVAIGNDSHAEGYGTTARGLASHSEGNNTHATGENAHAEGLDTEASGDRSHAEGVSTVAYGYASHAEGSKTSAFGVAAHAEGEQSMAIGEAAHSEGVGTMAVDFAQTVVGRYNRPIENAMFIVGNGEDSMNPSNAFVVYRDGSIEAPGLPAGGTQLRMNTLVCYDANMSNIQQFKFVSCKDIFIANTEEFHSFIYQAMASKLTAGIIGDIYCYDTIVTDVSRRGEHQFRVWVTNRYGGESDFDVDTNVIQHTIEEL